MDRRPRDLERAEAAPETSPSRPWNPAAKRTLPRRSCRRKHTPNAARGAGWERVEARGPGPFVTRETLRRPDGSEVAWHSRRHRKAHLARQPRWAQGEEPVWWRPRRRAWWMSVLFSIGSLCFAAAAVAAQWARTSRPAIDVTFFVGSIFFTSASYLQYAEAVNVPHHLRARPGRRVRPASWEPGRIDWLAAVVQFAGTLFFNVSTFAAMKTGLTTHQQNARVWAPDALGSICFLVSSELAYAEVCNRWLCVKWRSLSWRIVALNLMGSVAFGAAAIASWIEPSSGEPVSARIANGGTALGGLCFLLGAIALMPEAAGEEQARQREPAPSAA
jgi:hypothetical protein